MSKIRPEIIYVDQDYVVVNKPAGILSIPDRFVPDKPNLLNWLQEYYPEVLTVHRIDRDTSGAICFALHAAAHRHLSLQFEAHTVQKVYVALLDGVLREPEGTIDKHISPHPTRPGQMMAGTKGKAALTHYRLLEAFQKFSLVEAEIKTGRTHQIRVHFQSIGLPLAVDELYGPRAALLLSEIKGRTYQLGKDQEERPLLDRLSLHAHRLSFMPLSGDRLLSFEASLPKDLSATIRQLQKWSK